MNPTHLSRQVRGIDVSFTQLATQSAVGVRRDSYEVAVLVDQAINCLSDPEGAICRKLEAFSAIEFLYRVF